MAADHPSAHHGTAASVDFIDHIDHWLEYLTELLNGADEATKPKWQRQIRYLLGFRAGTNCNINHNWLLWHYYSHKAGDGGHTVCLPGQNRVNTSGQQAKIDAFMAELKDRQGPASMSIHPDRPIQSAYQPDDPAFKLILKALASADLFFMQGPPGTGKTTAIVEIILQLLTARPEARILVSSETHVAVDNALDRLAKEAPPGWMDSILRYPEFRITEFECEHTPQADAPTRAHALWHKADQAAPELTVRLRAELEASRKNDDGSLKVAHWQARNLAEMHQVIGVTCNQLDHLLDSRTQMFDLAIVDECSKATLPEWLMAMSVAKKCILVGDHKQLPPTFCTEESEVLAQMDDHKERLIRNGVIERLFENLPAEMKGTLGKQFRMLPHIGQFISQHFYKGELEHHRTETDHEFKAFGWLTYKSNGYRVPAQPDGDNKVLINRIEVRIIMAHLARMHEGRKQASAGRKISVAVITPYRAQSKALREALRGQNFSQTLAVEVDTVDAFQGRQADIVFFSFVRNTGPATFYADDRRLNVAISRARDAVYLVGDVDYIRRKRLPVLDALVSLDILDILVEHRIDDNLELD